MQEKTFWLDTVEIPAAVMRELPQRVDVAIIGAGFTGLSAARTLAKSALQSPFRLTNIGWRQFRNGGMVLTGLKLPAATLIDRYGKEIHRKDVRRVAKIIDSVEKLVREKISPAISSAAATSR